MTSQRAPVSRVMAATSRDRRPAAGCR